MWEHDEIYVAVQREREEIVKELDNFIGGAAGITLNGHEVIHGLRHAINLIKARGEKKPEKIEHLAPRDIHDPYFVNERINELIDAVNKMRARP